MTLQTDLELIAGSLKVAIERANVQQHRVHILSASIVCLMSQARQDKDYPLADKLRAILRDAGISVRIHSPTCTEYHQDEDWNPR